ncbi:MAG: peptide deformylase [Actinomycetales bacterium]
MTWTPDPDRGTARAIRQLGDPVLRTAATPVTSFDERLRRLVDDMFASMYAADGVGLAANQIGSDLDVFVYDCPDGDARASHDQAHGQRAMPPASGVGYLVNSRLDRTWGETLDWDEGCLSVLGLLEPTNRADCAAVSGVDVEGEPVQVIGSALLGRCLQHETDHLRGLVYLDRVPRLKRIRALRRWEKQKAQDGALG